MMVSDRWLSERTRKRLAVAMPPLVSVALGLLVHTVVPMATPVADASTYDAIAAGLLGQNTDPNYGPRWAIEGLADRGPVYPLVVAAVYGVSGEPSPSGVGWLQAVLFVPLTTYLIYVAGREAFSRRVGLVSAWAFAVWFPVAWYTLWLLTETTTSLLMAATLALLAATISRRSSRLAFASGLMLGVLSLAHSAYQFLALIVVIALAVHWIVYERGSLRLAVRVAAGAVFVFVPYFLIVSFGGHPGLGEGARGYGGGGGWTFYVASRAETDFLPIPSDYTVADYSTRGGLPKLGQLIERGEIEVEPTLLATIRRKLASRDPAREILSDSDYYRAGVRNLADQPEHWPRKVAHNAGRLFVVPSQLHFYRDGPLPARWREMQWPFGSSDNLTDATWFRRPWRPLSVLLIALVGVGAARLVARLRNRLVLFVPLAAQVTLLLLALVEWRYVIPLWPSMFLLAGLGLTYALDRARTVARC